MANGVKFDLPNSGYDVIQKMLKAYAVSGQEPVALSDVASRSGIGKTQLSENHKFLVSVGVLTGGNKKQLSPEGFELARAIHNDIKDEVSKNWATIVRKCEDTRKVLDMVRIQNGINNGDAEGRVLHALGTVSSRNSKTGVNCLLDIFLQSDLIQERDGKYIYNNQYDSSGAGDAAGAAKNVEPDPQPAVESTPQEQPHARQKPSAVGPSLHIDVQVHIDPGATPEQIDQIFASMAKHLYGRE